MKKRKIASLYMLMAMTISACGNQTPQADLAEMQENDTITADAEGQTEYEEAAAEKEGSSEDNSIVEVSNSENNIVEITDYIGNFEKVVEIMDMEYDNEAATGSNNYCIDNFKLSWDDYGYYAVSNQENEKVALYGVRIGDNRAAVLSRIQEYGYTYQNVSEDSDAIYLLQDGKIIYIEIFYNGEQVTSWYVNNYEEGEIEDIKNILELKEQYNIKTAEAWKSAYIDFVFEKYMNDDFLLDEPLQKYKLVNVNGDNIPELYINFGSTAGGDMLCSYFDNSVIYQPMWNYGFSYIEGENLFWILAGIWMSIMISFTASKMVLLLYKRKESVVQKIMLIFNLMRKVFQFITIIGMEIKYRVKLNMKNYLIKRLIKDEQKNRLKMMIFMIIKK